MSNQIKVGAIQIALLSYDGLTKSTINYLPAPNKGNGVELEWDKKSFLTTLYDGSEMERLLGYVPVLNLSWSIYDDVNQTTGHTIGSANGNQLDYNSFLALLDNLPGYLRISMDGGVTGFTASSWKLGKAGVMAGGNFATNVSITFRGSGTGAFGTGIYATKVLGAF
jgi:hypothetical protein